MLISEVDAVPQPRLLFCNGLIFLFPSHQFAQQPQITGKLMVLPEESNLKIVHRPISNFVGAQMLMVMEEGGKGAHCTKQLCNGHVCLLLPASASTFTHPQSLLNKSLERLMAKPDIKTLINCSGLLQ